jgi:2'-5' RNA ligase
VTPNSANPSFADFPAPEAALIIPIPESESLIGDFRLKFDPSARLGIPAHITVNFPFQPYFTRPDEAREALKALLTGFSPFDFELVEIRTFPGVIYLAPKPEEPFLVLIDGVANLFPDSPPYGGAFRTPVPHLTVAQVEESMVAYLKDQLEELVAGRLPLSATASEIRLMENTEKIWKQRQMFALRR